MLHISLLAACGEETLLIVDVRTDVIPGAEFSRVELRADDDTPLAGVDVAMGDDWIEGERVAEISGLPEGQLSFDVVLLRPNGDEELRRGVRVEVRGRLAITIALTRDCIGRSCPDGQACYQGMCVPPECTVESSDLCEVTPSCVTDAECVTTSACGIPRCVDNACLYGADAAACGAEEVCDPVVGCAARFRGPVPPIERATVLADVAIFALAIDVNDNVYVAGSGSDEVDVGGGPLPYAGNRDVLVASFTPAGVHRWSGQFGSPTSDDGVRTERAFGIAVDDTGAAYVTGVVVGTVDFGGGPVPPAVEVIAGEASSFVLALDPDGAYRWATRFPTGEANGARAVAVDGMGRSYFAGESPGDVVIAGRMLSGLGGDDAWMASFDSAGALVDARLLGGAGSDAATALFSDTDGSLWLAGETEGEADLGAGAVDAQSRDGFLTLFDPAGVGVRTTLYSDRGHFMPEAIAVDGSGVALGGEFSGSFDFAGRTLGGGGNDAGVLVVDRMGVPRWGRSFGGPQSDDVAAVAFGPGGEVYVAGELERAVDVGGGALAGNADDDAFVAAYDADGNHLWSIVIGLETGQTVRALAVDSTGALYAAGNGGPIDVGAGPVGGETFFEGFIVKWRP